MKLSIRMRIFLPVMLILIAFPMAAWFVFSYSLAGHMNYNARRDLDHMIERVDEIANDNVTEDLVDQIRNAARNNAGETQTMVLSGDYRVVYPRNYDDESPTEQMYAQALSALTQDSVWTEGTIFEESLENSRYMIYYRYFGNDDPSEVYYAILYCPIHDVSPILEQVSRLVLIIMGAMAAGAIVLFWFVAGSISGPVRRLSEAAHGIGEKKFQRVETGTTVKELCELEDEINQMQDKLLQADQAERTFFQNASHELRTPLMSISGYAQGIQHGVFEDASQAAGIILEESSRLTEVVDGILTLTRMDQLRYQVVPVDLSIREFIGERMERLEGLAYSKQISLVLEPGEEIKLITDAMLLERAFSNVVSNCIRYAGKEVRIAVTLPSTQIDDKLEIQIADDGPGIRSEELEHLFDRFYKGKNGNHGLGLAIARASLEYMGGTIEAVSSLDGAVFLMRLPQDCRSFAMDKWNEVC